MSFQNGSIIMFSGLSAPAGHSQVTTADPLTANEINTTVDFTITRSDIADTTAEAGFDNIFTEVATLVEDHLENTMSIDVINNHVDYIGRVDRIRPSTTFELYKNDASSELIVTVNILAYTYDIPA